eukprot:GEMP01014567.1.p1 GENE.GEMP01014567.1~~GEMP01014567.1.p1  ORF type:complete len:418 (-),score=83.53 GEMP01014567.1:1594-2847(-)
MDGASEATTGSDAVDSLTPQAAHNVVPSPPVTTDDIVAESFTVVNAIRGAPLMPEKGINDVASDSLTSVAAMRCVPSVPLDTANIGADFLTSCTVSDIAHSMTVETGHITTDPLTSVAELDGASVIPVGTSYGATDSLTSVAARRMAPSMPVEIGYGAPDSLTSIAAFDVPHSMPIETDGSASGFLSSIAALGVAPSISVEKGDVPSASLICAPPQNAATVVPSQTGGVTTGSLTAQNVELCMSPKTISGVLNFLSPNTGSAPVVESGLHTGTRIARSPSLGPTTVVMADPLASISEPHHSVDPSALSSTAVCGKRRPTPGEDSYAKVPKLPSGANEERSDQSAVAAGDEVTEWNCVTKEKGHASEVDSACKARFKSKYLADRSVMQDDDGWLVPRPGKKKAPKKTTQTKITDFFSK